MSRIKPNPFQEFPRIEFILSNLVDDYNKIIENPHWQQKRWEKMKKDIAWLHRNVPSVLKFANKFVDYIDWIWLR